MSLNEIIPFSILATALLIAAVDDLRFRRIPNWLTYSTIMIAVIYHSIMSGFEGFLFSAGGIGVGIAVLIIPYLMEGMGAGDAKLMGAVGGLLGPKGVLIAFLFTAIIGGIYALALLAIHGSLRETGKRYGTMLWTFLITKQFIYMPFPSDKKKQARLCYGLAIALGTLISVYSGMNN
jgi:prepilin peptidase CpaA